MAKLDFTVKSQTQTLGDFLRSDRLFAAKNIDDSKLRKLLVGLAYEIGRAEGTIQLSSDEYDIPDTTHLIEEWEAALGIPDECINLDTTLSQRRLNVLTKLTAMGVSTKAGFEALALTFGYTVTVTPGQDALTFPFTFPFILGDSNPKWTMVVNMPLATKPAGFDFTFPITFDDDGSLTNIIICLFNKLAPSFIKVMYNYV